MKRLSLFLMTVFCAYGMAMAQRTVSGQIVDDNGVPLIGANVVVKGTTVGTVTDFDGNYSLTLPDGGETLVITYTGYNTQEIAIGQQSVINITMSEGVQLGEVVVTGLGIRKEKRALGYSVTTVSEELITKRPEADVSRILQGKVPGMNITSTSGVSGTGTNITIRGYSSITGSNQPLFVVDGVPFNSATNQQSGFAAGGVTSSSRMLDLDPNNIESVSVLKGLSATVLYGDQGRNGVILVTTKTGGSQKKGAEISVQQSYFQNRIASLPDYQNNYGGGFQQLTPPSWFFSNWGADFSVVTQVPHPVGVSGVANIRNAFPQYAIDPTQPWGNTPTGLPNVALIPNRAYDDIGKSFFRTGNVYNTSVQASGGVGASSYNVSFGYQDEQGFTPGNDLKKINFGLGLNTPITDKLSVRSSFAFINTDMVTPPLNAGFGSNANDGIPSIFANVLYTPRNVDLNEIPFEHPVDRSSVYYRGGNDIVNPIWATKYYANSSIVNRFFNSTTLNYDITKNLGILYRVGLDTYTENQEIRLNKGGGAGVSALINSGLYQSTTIKNTIWNHDVNLNYNVNLTDKLILTALLGGNYRQDNFERFGLASTNQLTFGLFNHANFISTSSRLPVFPFTPINRIQEERRAGIYASATLDYADFLYVNVMARNDWTSTVEPDNRRILYPGASVSFVPTTAFSGLESNTLRYLKVRAAYGTSAGFPFPYSTRNILIQNPRGWANAGGTTFPTQTTSTTLGNPNLKPELQKELEFGLEGVLFNNRLRFEGSWYSRNTSDLITDAPLDRATGFAFTNINIGNLRTRGVEINATVTPVRTNSGLKWDLTANFGRYRSIITELTAGLDEVVFSGFTNLGNFAIAGQPYGLIKGVGIERDANGNKIVLPNGRYKETSDIVELGDPNPAFTSSLINAVSFKGFNLGFMMEYRHKGVIVSNTVKGVLARGLSKDTDQLDRALSLILPGVQEDGTPNNVQVTAANYFFDNYFFSDEAITFDGSTIRLREASLSYTLPSSVLGNSPFKAASLTVTGSNIWFRALNMPKFVNFDTDVLSTGVGNGLGFDYLTGPSARRYGATLNLTF